MKKGESAKIYDLAVIGAGIAGLSGAMYAGRLGLKTVCFGASHGSEMPLGGVITTTKQIENYPGFESINGGELAGNMKKQAETYKAELKEEMVESVEKTKEGFAVKTDKGRYSSRTVLFATGTKWRKLDIPGGKEFENRGVAYCALCDGPFFKNKQVAIIGGSDVAVKDALLLAEHAKKVYIIYRGEKIRGENANLERIAKNKKIEIINNTNVKEITGNKTVTSVVLDRKFNGKDKLQVDGVFAAIGNVPLSKLAKEIGARLNDAGEIMTNPKTGETSINGVFAAGDVSDSRFKQAITSAAEGCIAAHSAFEYLKK
ncbi:MAG: FAD-dependent oxidoreductase [archaeon]|jgi:thioredoxin reductase (NADPH)|nr:FAD-dependent oxidoreductase [archaeon]